MTKHFVQRFSLAGGDITYGRGPAELALADTREMTLVLERLDAIGPMQPGMTVYRKARGDWRVLPDPEKAK